MVVLENQKAYKCEGCNRRYFTKSSCVRHEKEFCKKHPESPRNPVNCPHDEDMMQTAYSEISGEENRYEPDYDYCANCGKRDFD